MQKVLLSLLFLTFSISVQAQTNVSGVVHDNNGESLAGVNVLVKGKVIGTITDINGKFTLQVKDNPPISLEFSYVGYATQTIEISESAVSNMEIILEEQSLLGQEVVVSASRVEESILESPVTIEKMDILDIQNTPADNYYKAIANLKGVDMTASSINFQIVNARGFGSTGNTRFVQLVDGMDTQAPALNFPIGNLNGPSELDVESLELIPGASSALYGPNAFNGILLINSKNPFEYQGLSAFVKTGVNHVGSNADQGMAPMIESSIRYAKSFKDKFAFKVNFTYMKADDWHGTDLRDREVARTPQGFTFNPGADKLHAMGDEASVNIAIFPLSAAWNTLAGSKVFAPGRSARDYAGDLPAHVVSITPFNEVDLIDYGAENTKVNTGLFYRINDDVEASYLFNAGFGTSIYTGAQRYSLSNFGITQHRVQLRGDNFTVKAYGTFEDSGDSYITEFLAKRIIDQSTLNNSVTDWLADYGIFYLESLYNQGYDPGEVDNLSGNELVQVQMNAHNFARNEADAKYWVDPGSDLFKRRKESGLKGVVPFGPKFNDQTRMYQIDGQYDFKDDIDFMSLQAGGSYRLFSLRSNGTIFPDTPENPITIREYGIYLQGSKDLANDKLKLSGSVRYDKNENFDGQTNPRISLVVKPAKDHNIRFSYQTGFRIPTTQGQHISLDIISARLLGGLRQYYEQYNLNERSSAGIPLGYEGFSVQDYSSAVFNSGASQQSIFNPANIALLEPYETIKPVQPERVRSFEVGYKSLIDGRLMFDGSFYYNIYNNFISQIRIRKAEQFTTDAALDDPDGYGYTYNPDPNLEGTPNYGTLLNGTTLNTFQVYTNIDQQITSQGLAAGITYSLPKNYSLGANYSWNVINNVPDGFLAEFNTPEHKYNIMFGNRKLTDKIGFGLTYRWQSDFWWESSFTIPANGTVPAFSTLDAQVTYKVRDIKSLIKLGGSNILNNKYNMSLGGPNIGAIYYLSITFDELMN